MDCKILTHIIIAYYNINVYILYMKILVIEIKVVQNSILYTTALSGDGCFPPQGRRFQTEKKYFIIRRYYI